MQQESAHAQRVKPQENSGFAGNAFFDQLGVISGLRESELNVDRFSTLLEARS